MTGKRSTIDVPTPSIDATLTSPPCASTICFTMYKPSPVPLPQLDRGQVLAATEHDKKNTGTSRVMVFPKRVGECVVVSDVTEDEIAFGFDSLR